ncbi:hypothetical protein B8W73_16160 [Arthrobacter agilis]|nr:hypothetical protein B8W73_16160 [Arthrobacter agilis]
MPLVAAVVNTNTDEVTVKPVLVAAGIPLLVAVSVYPAPSLSRRRSLKVAVPSVLVIAVRVPVRLLPPGFAPIARVMG